MGSPVAVYNVIKYKLLDTYYFHAIDVYIFVQ